MSGKAILVGVSGNPNIYKDVEILIEKFLSVNYTGG